MSDTARSYVKRISENQCAMCGRRDRLTNDLIMTHKMALCHTCIMEVFTELDATITGRILNDSNETIKYLELIKTFRAGAIDRIRNAQHAFDTECLIRRKLTIVANATPPKDSMTMFPYTGGVEGTKVETRPIFDPEYFKLYSYVKAYDRHKLYEHSPGSYKPFIGCITKITDDTLIISNRNGDECIIKIDDYIHDGWNIRKLNAEEVQHELEET